MDLTITLTREELKFISDILRQHWEIMTFNSQKSKLNEIAAKVKDQCEPQMRKKAPGVVRRIR